MLIAEYEEKLAAFENELQERTLTKTTLPENKLIEAKEELARFKFEHNQELKRLQTEISSMKETQLQQLDSVKKEVKKQFKLLVGAVVVASLAVVLLVFFNSRGGIGASSTPAERLKQSTLASDAPTVSSTPKQGALKASQARFHVGENQTVCGKLVHIHEFAQGLYLNLDKAYPPVFVTFLGTPTCFLLNQ